MSENKSSGAGIGCFIPIGAILAALLSFKVNGSILWGFVHGFCSWFYVIYWLIFKL